MGSRKEMKWFMVMCLVAIAAVALIMVRHAKKEAGDCPNVYVDGKRVGVTLKDCEMREYTTFTRLPEGSSVEVKGEDYETAYFRTLAIVRLKRDARIKVGDEKKHKWQPVIREWCIQEHTPRAYIRLERGESLKFRERIEDGFYLMATGWYEPSR